MKIKINCAGEQTIFHEYFKPFKCTSDIDLPKMYNQGYNSFRFEGGEPDFIGENMPQIPYRSLRTHDVYECQIIVSRSNGTTVSGRYINYVCKITGNKREIFDFD